MHWFTLLGYKYICELHVLEFESAIATSTDGNSNASIMIIGPPCLQASTGRPGRSVILQEYEDWCTQL